MRYCRSPLFQISSYFETAVFYKLEFSYCTFVARPYNYTQSEKAKDKVHKMMFFVLRMCNQKRMNTEKKKKKSRIKKQLGNSRIDEIYSTLSLKRTAYFFKPKSSRNLQIFQSRFRRDELRPYPQAQFLEFEILELRSSMILQLDINIQNTATNENAICSSEECIKETSVLRLLLTLRSPASFPFDRYIQNSR